MLPMNFKGKDTRMFGYSAVLRVLLPMLLIKYYKVIIFILKDIEGLFKGIMIL